MSNPALPISQQNLNRIMVVLIIVLALATGYFQTVYRLEKQKSHKMLEECSALNQNCVMTETESNSTAQ